MNTLSRAHIGVVSMLLFAFSVAPPAEAQSLRERLRQAGERVTDRAQDRAEERLDATIERAEDRVDDAFDYAEGQADDLIDGADRRAETAVLRAEDAVEGTIRCVVGDTECVERAREQQKEVVLTDPEGHIPAHQQRAAPAGANVAAGAAFQAGDVLVPKIDNVQVHSAPRADASVVGHAARTDEFVFLGDEQEGFVMVQGATLSGWVRKVLMDRR